MNKKKNMVIPSGVADREDEQKTDYPSVTQRHIVLTYDRSIITRNELLITIQKIKGVEDIFYTW